MKRIFYYITILSLFFCVHQQVVFAENKNVGIIEGIWFSEETFFQGDEIRIYTAVQNNSGSDVNGIVEFFDTGVLLGVKEFTAKNNSINEVFIDTQVAAGPRIFSIQITEIQKNLTGEVLVNTESVFYEKEIIVDTDFDNDTIADTVDTDDDNDGYSDSEEEKQGSNPLDRQDIPVVQASTITQAPTIHGVKDFFHTPQNTENLAYEKDLQERIPDPVASLTKNTPFLYNISRGISSMQYSAEKGIQGVLDTQQDSEQPLVSMNINDEQGVGVSLDTDTARSSFFVGVLHVLQKIISFWWLFPIVICFGIWIVLKIIFKIFSRKK